MLTISGLRIGVEKVQNNYSMKYIKLIVAYMILFSSCIFGQVNPEWPKVKDEKYNKRLNFLLSGSVPFMEVSTLETNIQQYTVLDTRDREEYEISHIPGAVFVGPDFDLKNVENLDRENPIVVYCSVGYRSEKYGEKLLKAGFTEVSNLYGGIFEWLNAGNNVALGNEILEDKLIHTYNASWGKFVTNPHCTKVH